METNTIPSVFDEINQQKIQFEYASVGQRFINFIIDLGVYLVYNILVVLILTVLFRGNFAIRGVLAFLFVTFNYASIYFLVEGISKGRSLGKIVTKTVVVTYDLTPITWKHALMRSLWRIVPFEAFTALDGNPLHDSRSHTIVIKKQMQQLH